MSTIPKQIEGCPFETWVEQMIKPAPEFSSGLGGFARATRVLNAIANKRESEPYAWMVADRMSVAIAVDRALRIPGGAITVKQKDADGKEVSTPIPNWFWRDYVAAVMDGLTEEQLAEIDAANQPPPTPSPEPASVT